MNWSLPARCCVESRQCRRRTIRNKVLRAASAIASGRPKAKRRPPSPLNLFSLKHDMIGHISSVVGLIAISVGIPGLLATL
jgi:hypothetical protein